MQRLYFEPSVFVSKQAIWRISYNLLRRAFMNIKELIIEIKSLSNEIFGRDYKVIFYGMLIFIYIKSVKPNYILLIIIPSIMI